MKKFTVDYLNSLTWSKEDVFAAQRMVSNKQLDISMNSGGCRAEIFAGPEIYKAAVSVSVSGDRFIINPSMCSCTCGDTDAQSGFVCSHVIAAAIMYEYSYLGEMNGLRGSDSAEPRQFGGRETATDSSIMRLLNIHSLPPQLSAMGINITLETTVTYDAQGFFLSFRVGSKRMYVIKDIGEFVKKVRSNEFYNYGKQFGFTHHIDSFRPEDRPMVQFICDWYEYQNKISGGKRFYLKGYTAGERYFRLSGLCLDAFLDAYRGDTLLLDAYNTPSAVEVARQDPPLTLTLSCPGSFCALDIRDNITSAFRGEKRAVAGHGGKMYFCSENFTRDVLPIAEDILYKRRPARIRRDDMSSFISYVLPSLERSANVDPQMDFEPFSPPELDACVYIERYSDRELSVRLRFNYGSRSFTGFGPELPHDGDFIKERTVRAVVSDVFSPCDREENMLIKTVTDDFLYDFERVGRARLEELCRVFCDDTFRLRIRRPGAVSVGVRMDSDLLRMDIDMSAEDMAELDGILVSLRSRKKYHRLKSGEFLSLEDTALAQLADIAEGLDLSSSELAKGYIELPAYRALFLDSAAKAQGGITFTRDSDFRRTVRTVHEALDADYDLPDGLRAGLRNYQRAGYRWLMTLSDAGFGCILADEMGLGKTLEILTVLLRLKENGCAKPSIVVCPASLVLNWQSEARRFVPSLSAVCVMGTYPARSSMISEALGSGADIIITSYDSLKRDISQYADAEFECVIADEAQYMKNYHTQNARAIKTLRGKRRFALTGTPIENSLAELWSIFDFIMPGYLFGYTRFRNRCELPIVRDGDDTAARNLKLMVSPFILRRLKQEVLSELPPKIETIIPVEMGETQRKLYLANTLEARRTVEAMPDSGSSRFEILALLTRLRQICCDPSLVYENYTGGSAKLEMCLELVRQCIDSGNKLLLFSQFTSMLDIIEKRLDDDGIRYYRISGDTPVSIRQFQVDLFNKDDVPVFLISLRAGGTGLNLTGASCVIHYDPWWNVSAQNQATDRTHRIGQRSTVQVYDLVIKDTIEQRIIELQRAKADLVDKVIEADQAALSNITTEELISLLEEQAGI